MLLAEVLSAILKWCSILGLLPGYSSKLGCFIPRRSYTYLLQLLLAVMYAFLIWKAVMDGHYLVMEIFYTNLLVFSTMLQNLKLSLWNVDHLSLLFSKMDKLDLMLAQRYVLDVSAQKYTTFGFAAINFLSLVVISILSFAMVPGGFVAVVSAFYCYIEYLSSTQSTLQLFILHSISKRSRCVSKVVLGYSQSNNFVENFALLQRKVSQITDIYNELFGWNTFLHIMVTFVVTLYMILMCMDLDSGIYSSTIIVPSFLVILIEVLHILLLSVKGQGICDDSETIISSCCDLMANPRKDQNKNRLSHLLQQVSVKQARISAAGFFDVNFAMLFLLFNLLVTYVIALVQLIPN